MRTLYLTCVFYIPGVIAYWHAWKFRDGVIAFIGAAFILTGAILQVGPNGQL